MQQQSQHESHQSMWHLVTLEESGLSERVVRRLVYAGYRTIADLESTTKRKLRAVYQFGAKAESEVDELFERLGLMPIPEIQEKLQNGTKC